MKLIDFHVHLSRSLRHEKLVFPHEGQPDDWYWAFPERVVRYMDFWNIESLITLNIMNTRAMTQGRIAREGEDTQVRRDELAEEMRGRVRDLNDWVCELHATEPRIIPFVFADPVLFGSDAAAEVERCLAAGAVGVKVHPGISGHLPDDPRAMPVYELCAERGVPVLTDTSGQEDEAGQCLGAPINWRSVLRAFPQGTFVLAHMCGERWDEQLILAREFGNNLFFDMSGGFVDESHPIEIHREMPIQEGMRVFSAIGAERILFGSDAPAGRLDDTVRQLLSLGLPDADTEKILYSNAAELLKRAGNRSQAAAG